MKQLNDIEIFLLDLDGTIYAGNQLIDGAIEFISALTNANKQFIFLTNNSSNNKNAYKDKLDSLGLCVDKEIIFTSGEATSIYLKSIKKNPKVFLLGTPALEQSFIEEGIDIINYTSTTPDFIVLGFDTTLTYDKLWKACDYIKEGIPYIATHPDINCPLEKNKVKPDIGAMIAFIKASTGHEPYIVGKPNKSMVDMICKKYNFDTKNMAMVGDRLYTDISTAKNANIVSILVLSGATTMEEYKNSNIQADFVFDSVKKIIENIL